MLAHAYLRVSTDEQALGLDAQRASIEAWAARAGATVASWHIDDGVSGAAPLEECPGLLAALDSLERGSVLAVARRDRIARDVLKHAVVVRMVERAKARIASADGVANGDGPEDSLMSSLLAAFAAYERALIRRRTKAALAVKRARGERVSRHAPYGFRIAADGVRLEPEPVEQAALSTMRQMRRDGASCRAVAVALTECGVRNRAGREFDAWGVARILKRAGA